MTALGLPRRSARGPDAPGERRTPARGEAASQSFRAAASSPRPVTAGRLSNTNTGGGRLLGHEVRNSSTARWIRAGALILLLVAHGAGLAQPINAPTNLRLSHGDDTARPGPSNTGYKNAPDYPGRLTRFTGSLQSNQVYRFYDFPSGFHVPSGVANVTFYGCRFASNAVVDANVAVYGDNIAFDYSTFEPNRVGAPPASYNEGYQYGIDQRSNGRLTIDHSDFWGWGNAIQFRASSQLKPFVVKNSWFHDSRHDGGIDHTDAILENYGGQSYVVIDNNTIVAKGNTNGLALQNGNRTGYRNMTITNNYFSGFGYTVNMCGYFQGCSSIVFTDNTFGTDIRPVWGPLYSWRDGDGNLWRRNKWRVAPGGYSQNVADDGKYWWPNGTLSSSDYTR